MRGRNSYCSLLLSSSVSSDVATNFWGALLFLCTFDIFVQLGSQFLRGSKALITEYFLNGAMYFVVVKNNGPHFDELLVCAGVTGK